MKARKLQLHLTTLACLIAAYAPLFAQDTASAKQDLSLIYANVATNLPTIHTFAETPKNFDVVNATDEDLAFYGFPARPDPKAEPDHYAMWKRAMQAAKVRWNGQLKNIKPEKDSSDSSLATESMDTSVVANTVPATPTSYNWSGAVLTKSLSKFSPSQSFRDIYSLMTVPVGQPAFDSSCSLYSQLTWVGLNGYVKKAGIQPGPARGSLIGGTYAVSNCSSSDTVYYAVFGWNPSYLQIAFDVHPGDMVYTEVGAPSGGTGASYLFIEDLTTLTYNAYSVNVPPSYTYVGDTAEWIVSRLCCRNSGYPFPLLNTIDTFFDGGAALDFAGHTLYPGSQATSTQVLTMRNDSNDQNISLIYQGASGYEGNHSLMLQTTGCAFTGGCPEK